VIRVRICTKQYYAIWRFIMKFLWLWQALTTNSSIPSITTCYFCGLPFFISIHWCNSRIQNVDLLYVRITWPKERLHFFLEIIYESIWWHVTDFRLSSEIMQAKMVYGNTGFFSWHGYVLHEGITYKSCVPRTSQMTSRLLRHMAAAMHAHNVLCNSYNTWPLLCARITCYVTVITE
jgi:hypothetical protein